MQTRVTALTSLTSRWWVLAILAVAVVLVGGGLLGRRGRRQPRIRRRTPTPNPTADADPESDGDADPESDSDTDPESDGDADSERACPLSKRSSSVWSRMPRTSDYAIGEQGGTLAFATIGEPLTFNPALLHDASSSGVLSYLFEGLHRDLVAERPDRPRVGGGVGTIRRMASPGTFRLREDVTWHDGEPFTSARTWDFTFNRVIYNEGRPTRAPGRRSPSGSSTRRAASGRKDRMTVSAPGRTTRCSSSFRRRSLPFLRSMGTAIYPKHILEPRIDDGTFAETWNIDTDPSEVIGTGPFTIERYDPGERIVFQRNPNYWLKGR